MLTLDEKKRRAVERAKIRLENQLKPKGRFFQALHDIILIVDKLKNKK